MLPSIEKAWQLLAQAWQLLALSKVYGWWRHISLLTLVLDPI